MPHLKVQCLLEGGGYFNVDTQMCLLEGNTYLRPATY